jgi:type III secretory pathway component EscR
MKNFWTERLRDKEEVKKKSDLLRELSEKLQHHEQFLGRKLTDEEMKQFFKKHTKTLVKQLQP